MPCEVKPVPTTPAIDAARAAWMQAKRNHAEADRAWRDRRCAIPAPSADQKQYWDRAYRRLSLSQSHGAQLAKDRAAVAERREWEARMAARDPKVEDAAAAMRAAEERMEEAERAAYPPNIPEVCPSCGGRDDLHPETGGWSCSKCWSGERVEVIWQV